MEVNSIKKKNLFFFLLANSISGWRVCDGTKKKDARFSSRKWEKQPNKTSPVAKCAFIHNLMKLQFPHYKLSPTQLQIQFGAQESLGGRVSADHFLFLFFSVIFCGWPVRPGRCDWILEEMQIHRGGFWGGLPDFCRSGWAHVLFALEISQWYWVDIVHHLAKSFHRASGLCVEGAGRSKMRQTFQIKTEVTNVISTILCINSRSLRAAMSPIKGYSALFCLFCLFWCDGSIISASCNQWVAFPQHTPFNSSDPSEPQSRRHISFPLTASLCPRTHAWLTLLPVTHWPQVPQVI